MSRDLSERMMPVPDEDVLFNYAAHRRSHLGEVKVLTFTSKTTLNTSVIDPPLYPTVPGRIISVRLNVTGAPSSTLTGDVLINGTSIFPTSSKPTIASGALKGSAVQPDTRQFGTDDKIACQLTDTGSATGPVVFQIKVFVAVETEMNMG